MRGERRELPCRIHQNGLFPLLETAVRIFRIMGRAPRREEGVVDALLSSATSRSPRSMDAEARMAPTSPDPVPVPVPGA